MFQGDLNFLGMFERGLPLVASEESSPPLAFPVELWADLSDNQKAACFSGHALIGAFGWERTLELKALSERAGLAFGEALEGLRILGGMELVAVEAGESGPVVTLLAKPEEYVRVTTPDGSVRWVFVTRPLEAPQIDPANLN